MSQMSRAYPEDWEDRLAAGQVSPEGGRESYASVTRSCGHQEVLHLRGTDYERALAIAREREDVCDQCLNGIISQGLDALLAHEKAVVERQLAVAK